MSSGAFIESNLTAGERHELRVLELVEEHDRITQRGVAIELEIAVGMANALIKRLVHKGYIKVKDAPSRRYGYYITAEGFMEKSRLVSKYISNSFKFFGQVRRDYEAIASHVSSDPYKAVCCVGTGEVLQIAKMVFAANNVRVICVLDVLAHEEKRYYQNFTDIPEEMVSEIGYLVITETRRPDKVYEVIMSHDIDREILVPVFMKIKKPDFQSGRV